MRNEAVMRLTERELQILRDISFAKMKMLEGGEPVELPIPRELTEDMARQFLPAFDLFRCGMTGNAEAIKKLARRRKKAESVNADIVIAEYRKVMCLLMCRRGYTENAVKDLRQRMREFIKEQKKAGPRTLYIADCHFFHDRICHEMDRRGFSGYEEMNEYMIAQWNQAVTAGDDVYILGDFCISRGEATAKILKRLNGKLHLIIGNHDRYLQDKNFAATEWFRSVESYREIHDNGRTVILSHYPVFCYKGQYRQDPGGNPLTYMLYGHVHDTHDERLVHRFIRETQSTKAKSRHSVEPALIPCNMINCFCMFSDYQPKTLDEWINIDRLRRQELDEELTISANTLNMIDRSMMNLAKGVASEPVDLKGFADEDK